MEEESVSKTKICRYCGETIQAVAIKCRYCGEWLESPVRTSSYGNSAESLSDIVEQAEGTQKDYYEGSPSYVAIAGSFIMAGILIIFCLLIIFWPVPAENGGEIQTAKTILGLVVSLITGCWIMGKMAKLKSTFYRLTRDRLELQSGLLGRKIDNIDLVKIVDYRLDSTLMDRMFNVGTITLFTSDKTDPEIELFKIKDPQRAFEIIKKTSVEADSKRTTIHME